MSVEWSFVKTDMTDITTDENVEADGKTQVLSIKPHIKEIWKMLNATLLTSFVLKTIFKNWF